MNKKHRANSIDVTIGNQIRIARTSAGLTQIGLGGAVGRSGQQIHKFETGRNRTSSSVLFQIAQATGIEDMNHFLYGLEESPERLPRNRLVIFAAKKMSELESREQQEAVVAITLQACKLANI